MELADILILTLVTFFLIVWSWTVIQVKGAIDYLKERFCRHPRVLKAKPESRTVATQSQTTYKYKYREPRFKPLGEDEQGVWEL